MLKYLFFALLLGLATDGAAQVNYPRDYFGSPLQIPLTLAGNFGEIRPNHFHAGFDIRTGNKEGQPVLAVADGYVSRIKISSVGYGKALYITHPNGYVSVYGHLREFVPVIQTKTRALQEALQSFELDTMLAADLLPVKKGDLIGFSGNTGSSQSPHLHFEIRNEITEMPVNPYYFGYQVKDDIKPTIVNIVVYPMNEAASVNDKNRLKKIYPKRINGSYVIPAADSITVNGDIGFGINCYDKENEGSGTNNVFSIELLSGGKRIYYYEMETFSFDNARYVNAHIDYAEKQRTHQTIQRCFLTKNNPLEIYKGVVNRGIVNFNDDKEHWITFIIKDYVGNQTELALKVKSTAASKMPVPDTTGRPRIWKCDADNEIGEAEFQAFFPPFTLYDDQPVTYKMSYPTNRGFYSNIYAIEDESVVLQKAMILKMYVQGIPPDLYKKLCIVSIEKDNKLAYEGGTFLTDFVFTEVKHLGKFAVTMDTQAPKIKPLFLLPKDKSIPNFSAVQKLKFKVTDNLSGIKKYRATIDGHWVLCEYDQKSDLVFYTFDDSIQPGTHQFKLEITDDRENVKVWETIFKR
ncbi:MAG TPA: M23 family metallopeptidase [Bacteroidia bacterium]|jgi:hypothetical protein|nr:M23 family metallopeptidase [Bacteroidia bacterium]